WPHVAAILLGILALIIPARLLAYFGMLAALVTASIGGYHTGVEKEWWEGPSSCSAGDTSGLSVDQLMDQIMNAPLVRCDEVAWQMFGLSMASWNMVASLILALLWLMAARAPRAVSA
ncbi:MAG: disulfide bond formation protein B, partial [Pseudomonadota bacterium]